MRTLQGICCSIFSSIFIFGASFALAQGPWNFNGSQDGWVVANSTVTTSATALEWNVKPGTSNWNKLTLTDPGLDPSTQGAIVAVTLKNDTANTNLVVGIKQAGTYAYTRSQNVLTNQTEFSTHYVDISSNGRWTGTPKEILLRFRQNNSGV